jgi:hypothetical protein
VEGPVCVAGCTTKESVYEDNSNRSFLLHLDESKEQDEKIMHYQRLKSAGKIDLKEQAKVLFMEGIVLPLGMDKVQGAAAQTVSCLLVHMQQVLKTLLSMLNKTVDCLLIFLLKRKQPL